MTRNPKIRYILKIALFYTIGMMVFIPLFDIITGEDYRRVLEQRLFNLPKLFFSLAFYLLLGFLMGWLSWKQKSKNQE